MPLVNSEFVPYQPPCVDADEMQRRAVTFYETMRARRSVRHFAADPVPRQLIELAIRTAATAPSGAHRQPWTFVAISNPDIKRQIRVAAEKEEYESYVGGRMPPAWLAALEPLRTNWQKPYLEIAPWIVVVFEQMFRQHPDGVTSPNYYVKESVGIACGLFIAALHQMGLSTLTHTPSPMGFLSEILHRPKSERPVMLFPIGYPAADAMVPDLQRKELVEVSVWFP